MEAPVKHAPAPTRIADGGEPGSKFLLAIADLLDDTGMPQELAPDSLPHQALGPSRTPQLLTYEFAIRVSDGYRWSDWSPTTRRVSFAYEPEMEEAQLQGDPMQFTAFPQKLPHQVAA